MATGRPHATRGLPHATKMSGAAHATTILTAAGSNPSAAAVCWSKCICGGGTTFAEHDCVILEMARPSGLEPLIRAHLICPSRQQQSGYCPATTCLATTVPSAWHLQPRLLLRPARTVPPPRPEACGAGRSSVHARGLLCTMAQCPCHAYDSIIPS
jgi:hypothetical protein